MLIAVFCICVSGAVLLFTVLRIRSTLRRHGSVQSRPNCTCSRTPSTSGGSLQKSTFARSGAVGNSRTTKILTVTSVAFFVFWSPYVIDLMAQCFISSFKPSSAVEFSVMWLANSNSAVNVFIYSSTNSQFRRQCVLLASRLCCSRLSCPRSRQLHYMCIQL